MGVSEAALGGLTLVHETATGGVPPPVRHISAEGYLLRWELHWSEATTVIQNVIDNCPNLVLGHNVLAGRACRPCGQQERSRANAAPRLWPRHTRPEKATPGP
jgi:hypothetical protein